MLVGIHDDEELERLLLAHSPKLRAILDAADRRIDEGSGLGHEDFWREVEARRHRRERKNDGKKARSKR